MITRLLIVITTLLGTLVLCDNIHKIASVNDFIKFSNDVNNDINYYEGETVFLETDIAFTKEESKEFNFIGQNESSNFKGIFDGKGHVLSNLAINSSAIYTGLFGYSTGATIKNIVLDESCYISVATDRIEDDDQVFAGGILGSCEASTRECRAENIVSMGSVAIEGNIYAYFVGGIVGAFYGIKHDGTVSNCVNYGTVSSFVANTDFTFIGGIIGSPQRSSESNRDIYVQNCLNYGNITYSGNSVRIRLGGVAGFSMYSRLDNCVNFGTINSSGADSSCVGSIVGYADTSTINHCYWSKNALDVLYGCDYITTAENSSHFDDSLALSGNISVGDINETTLIGALNAAADYYLLRDYSHWLLNKDGNAVSFTFSESHSPIEMSSRVILLPSLASVGNLAFDGWYVDPGYEEAFEDYDDNNETELYGRRVENNNEYTITFDSRGGTNVAPVTGRFGNFVKLSTSIYQTEHRFLWWENEYGDRVPTNFSIPARNTTLKAAWISNHIKSISEFIEFSNRVYYGTSYYGTTVILETDIAFTDEQSRQFKFIGQDEYNYFRGAFEGNGHVISNLAIKSSGQYTGLFGYTTEIAVRNIVLDETCSVTTNFVTSEGDAYAFTGGLVGYCESEEGQCIIEDSVNMASVIAKEEIVGGSFIGGIAGALLSYSNPIILKNCVNYGTILSAGTNSHAFVGGVVGSPQSDETSNTTVYVQNCFNYGSIVHSGIASKARIGGISGLCVRNYLDNCFSSGIIKTPSSNGDLVVGGVTGYCEESTISHCYWTENVGFRDMAGYENNPVIVNKTSLISQINASVREEVGEYAAEKGFMVPFLLNLNGGKVNGIDQPALITILKSFKKPEKEGGNPFVSWFNNFECTAKYIPESFYELHTADLYAGWRNVTVTFDPRNGNAPTVTSANYGKEYGDLPRNPVKEGHEFVGWFIGEGDDENNEKVGAESIVSIGKDHTIYGHWSVKNYTIKFDFENGTIVESVLAFNATIEFPEELGNDGRCVFKGWKSDNITTMPGHDIAFSPLWDCKKISPGIIVTVLIICIIFIVFVFFVSVFVIILKRRRGNNGGSGYIKIDGGRINFGSNLSDKNNGGTRATRGIRGIRGIRNYKRVPDDDEGIEIMSESIREYDDLYPDDYKVPTLSEALGNAGLEDDKISIIMDACRPVGELAEQKDLLKDEFTYGNAIAVAMYTFSFGDKDYEDNPYNLINTALMDNDKKMLQEVSGILYHLMYSLRRLPRCTGKTLYRGSREVIDKRVYSTGNSVIWHGLSSVSPDMNSIKSSLEKKEWDGHKGKKKSRGTLFIIDGGWGYDIQPYSLFPDDEEILLEPEREFKVQSVIETGITIVKLRMLNTPLILPEVFGDT